MIILVMVTITVIIITMAAIIIIVIIIIMSPIIMILMIIIILMIIYGTNDHHGPKNHDGRSVYSYITVFRMENYSEHIQYIYISIYCICNLLQCHKDFN
jgi:hypothetical protein